MICVTGLDGPGAERLRTRFRHDFWVETDDGGFPALALDGTGRQVDAISSSAAHLLGTGILTPAQEARIAERLGALDLDSGWGLRTLSAMSPRFNPLSYHGGSVWPSPAAELVGRGGPHPSHASRWRAYHSPADA